MTDKKYIAILDNNFRDYTILSQMISPTYKCIHITSEKYSIDAITECSPICIMLNYESLDFSQEELLKTLNIFGILSEASVILLSNQNDYKIPKECVKYKVSDYIIKNNVTEYELIRTINSSLEKLNLRKEIMELNYQLLNSSKNDELTGLVNRSFLKEKIKEEVNKTNRNIEVISAAIFDIDFFSAINNSYSYNTGNRILKEISEIIIKSTRQTDIICRYGDDEFVVVFINRKEKETISKIRQRIENLAEVCRKIQIEISEHDYKLPNFTPQNHKIYTSVGITPFFSYLEIDEFLKRADRALNYAKTHGKGNIAVYYDEENIILQKYDLNKK
jgi:diguanylate cyclase (GGDEF)-like protein